MPKSAKIFGDPKWPPIKKWSKGVEPSEALLSYEVGKNNYSHVF